MCSLFAGVFTYLVNYILVHRLLRFAVLNMCGNPPRRWFHRMGRRIEHLPQLLSYPTSVVSLSLLIVRTNCEKHIVANDLLYIISKKYEKQFAGYIAFLLGRARGGVRVYGILTSTAGYLPPNIISPPCECLHNRCIITVSEILHHSVIVHQKKHPCCLCR